MANTQVASEFGTEEISTIVVHIPDVKQIKPTGIEAAKKLTELSGVRQGEFQIFNMDSILEQTNQMLSIMTTVIWCDCRNFPSRWWDWGHEYHVGICD